MARSPRAAGATTRPPPTDPGAWPPKYSWPGISTWSLQPASPGQHLVLMPGQLYFGGQAASARTLLGSCVAITLWHPRRRLGGMCHYLLARRQGPAPARPEGRFGDEALAMMVQALRQAGTAPADYLAHLYGGADTQPGSPGRGTGIGQRNIEAGWQLIDHYGFGLQAVDVGENIPRQVQMDLATGQVTMRRGAPIAPRAPA
jgi:chemotaxis protein CheD